MSQPLSELSGYYSKIDKIGAIIKDYLCYDLLEIFHLFFYPTFMVFLPPFIVDMPSQVTPFNI